MNNEAGGVNSEELHNNNLNPENGQVDGSAGDNPKTYSEEEYKNLQSFSTKAQQEKIALAEKLVKANPKELETMDVKLQNKVIENLYNASSMEELKIISPELFEEKNGDGEEVDDRTKLEQKVKLMEWRMNKGAVATAIENLKISNKDLSDTIPDFEKKIESEMSSFSSQLSIGEKAEKAFKLVTASSVGNGNAYLAMQGRTTVKGSSTVDNRVSLENSPLANAFKARRRK